MCVEVSVPGLSLQELLVEMEVLVAHRQQTHTLHPHPPLLLTLDWHLLETAQTKQLTLLEVAAWRTQYSRHSVSMNQGFLGVSRRGKATIPLPTQLPNIRQNVSLQGTYINLKKC